MSSILTNVAAMTALKNLENTNMQMQKTQNVISSGMKVSSAADNAGYWSIATSMRSNDSSLKAVGSSLGLGASAVGVAYNGINQAITTAQSIKTQLTSALQPGSNYAQVQSTITQLQAELKQTASSSAFSGQNYLSVDSSATGFNGTASIVSSYTESSTGTVTIGTIAVNIGNTKLFDAGKTTAASGQVTGGGILDGTFVTNTGTSTAATPTYASVSNLDISSMTGTADDVKTIQNLINGVNTAIQSMTTQAASLGAVQSRISDQQSFIKSLSASIETGVGSLVDADMTEESTKLQALQVQQQLGTQALSIANQSAQSILSLFK